MNAYNPRTKCFGLNLGEASPRDLGQVSWKYSKDRLEDSSVIKNMFPPNKAQHLSGKSSF